MPKHEQPRAVGLVDGCCRVLDKFPAGAYLCDSDGLITYYNAHAVEIWGRAPKLNDPADRFCGSYRLYSSDGNPIKHDKCWMALALQTGQEFISEEILIERPDGSKRTLLAHASPLYDESGRLEGAINVLVDITDRKTAEEQNAFLGAIIDSSDDAIISKSLDGTIKSWNFGAERIFGYRADEAIGQSIKMLIPPDRLDEEELILSTISQGKRIEHYDTIRRTKDGRMIDISITVSPVKDAHGRIVAASKIARDISVRKKNEAALVALRDKLIETDRRKNDFLALLAHELRNPLAAICHSLQLLRLDESLDPTAVRLREIIEHQSDQLVRLVDDLLDASRISSGKIELRRTMVDLATVIANAVQTARPLIDEAGHQLAVSMPEMPVVLDADPVRLAQVVGNLLCNAAKYTPPGGQIWLSARRKDDGVEIAVRDTGQGISASDLSEVFDLYMQVDSAKTYAKGGLGLGLALAKKLVSLHGGHIEAHSDGQGQGSTFTVWLPVAVGQDLARPVSDTGAPLRQLAVAPCRVLVVDDMRDVLFALSALIKKCGHHVETASDAQSALKMISTRAPDVVVSDILMPGMNGYELAQRIKQMPGMDGVTLVALTGYGQESDRQQALAAGFDYHLVKPVSMKALEDLFASMSCDSATASLAGY